MLANLVVSTLMVAVTVVTHFLALAGLLSLLNRRIHANDGEAGLSRQSLMILVVVFGLFAAHSVEIWTYAGLYVALGEFATLEEALYFSASTFTTVGFGDVVLDERWRLLSAIESANGFLLLGWSTAFLISVTARVRALEVEWSEARRRRVARGRDEPET